MAEKEVKNISEKEVQEIATKLIRKYDWSTKVIEDGVQLEVNDGQHGACVDITTGEDIESEIQRLIKAVDELDYVVIG